MIRHAIANAVQQELLRFEMIRHPSPRDVAQLAGLLVSLKRAVETVAETRDQAIIRLHVEDGWSYAEIAEHMGITRQRAFHIAREGRQMRGRQTPSGSE